MEERESTRRRNREGVRWVIRERIMEELQESHHMDDGELMEMIDRAIGDMGQEMFLPLKERLWLRGSLFDSFRRLDILQELIDDSSVSESWLMEQERYLWRKTEGWNYGTGNLRSRNSWRISYNRL